MCIFKMDNVQISWFKLLNQINYLRLFVCFLVTGFYTREQGRQTKGANTTSCEVNHRESLTDDLIRSKMNYRDIQFFKFQRRGLIFLSERGRTCLCVNQLSNVFLPSTSE